MIKQLEKFIISQLLPYSNMSDGNERVRFFLNYLDVICSQSLSEQNFEVLRERLENIAQTDYLESKSLDNALSIEPFLRELYCLETGVRSQVPFSKVMISFDVFDDNYLHSNRELWKFTTDPESRGKKNYFKKIFPVYSASYSFANAYLCRNMKAHQLKTLSLVDRATMFTDILNVFVTSTWQKKSLVMSYIDSVKINTEKYFQKVKQAYEKNKNYNNYIPAKGKVRLQYATSTEEDERDIFDFYEECQKCKRLKILGKAGMGKTTAIYELMNYDINNYNKKHRVPVIIKLIDITDETKEIEQLIANTLELSYETVEQLLKEGKLSVYLDGLNEITLGENSQRVLLRKIMKFTESYEKSFIVISNRENNHVEVMNGEPTYYMLPLNDLQIDDFIAKNFPPQNRKLIQDLKRQIENYPEMLSSARIPYMLKQLIDLTVVTNGQLPEKSGDITECFLKSIINREINEKKELRATYARDFLKAIAEEMPDMENASLNETQIRQTMAKTIEKNVLPVKTEEVAGILSLLVEMGILQKNGNGIAFAYPDYQEYYFMAAMEED